MVFKPWGCGFIEGNWAVVPLPGALRELQDNWAPNGQLKVLTVLRLICDGIVTSGSHLAIPPCNGTCLSTGERALSGVPTHEASSRYCCRDAY